ncbi:Uncharacterized protein Fot_18683 [Forsythia ovata]|uniref:Uncharacterized protein n=1 Tax=Forsythia ovata TaxID=205694 RepID=A0ABD1VJ95_9LAMI
MKSTSKLATWTNLDPGAPLLKASKFWKPNASLSSKFNPFGKAQHVASSLGLNKIKTQSGPLPHESFFSFGSRDRGASLGYSTLSKPLGRGGTGGVDGGLSLGSGNKKKKEKLLVENAHNGSNSESRPSRDHSPHMVQAQHRDWYPQKVSPSKLQRPLGEELRQSYGSGDPS